MKPYIGICDFMSVEQASEMLKVLHQHRRHGSERQLHVGVMMSYKTMKGLETRWSKAFPPKERVSSIFWIDSEDISNCLHYIDYEHDLDLARNLYDAIMHGGPYLNAVQLDMIWPDPSEVFKAVHASRKPLEVILQIGRQAIEEAKNDPSIIVNKLDDYNGTVHRVSLDKSMGQGKGLNADELLPIARLIHERFPEMGLTVTGGLGPATMHLIEPFIKEFPDVSIDAQGRLRPSGNAMDPVDWNLATTYLIKALEILP